MTKLTDLKGDMEIIAEYCGEDTARQLMRYLPGLLVYIPTKYTNRFPMNRLPMQVAKKLISELGGDTFYVPSLRQSKSRMETYLAIKALRKEGLTGREIALRLGVTQVWVYHLEGSKGIKRTRTPDPRQKSLF